MRVRFVVPALMTMIVAGSAHAEVLLGTAALLSGSAAWAFSVKLGVELAVRELNAAGGVLGQQVRVILADDQCEGEQAVAVAHKMVAEGVDVVVGHECSDAAIPASQVYAEFGIPMIGTMATNPRLTEQGFANVFRMCGRDDGQGVIAASLLADRWGRDNIAIVHDGSVYGKGLAEQAKEALTARGVLDVLFAEFDAEALGYFEVADRIEAAQVDVLYFAGLEQPGGLLIRELRERGDDVQFVSGDALHSELFTMVAGESGDGTLLTSFPDFRRLPAAADVVAALRATDDSPNDQGALLAYAAVQAWAQAVEQAGSLKPEGVIEALHTGTFQTIYGEIGFDAKGDVTGYDLFDWYSWHKGEVVPAELTN